jgi:hypothetical protein
MQRITNQRTRAQGIPQIVQKGIAPMAQNSVRTEDSLTAKLERTRAEVRRAQENVQAVEGRFLDFATADALQRALFDAARNLQELTLQVAVLERKR